MLDGGTALQGHWPGHNYRQIGRRWLGQGLWCEALVGVVGNVEGLHCRSTIFSPLPSYFCPGLQAHSPARMSKAG